jgi:uncharacterized protein (TIGR03083 family)
MTFDAISTIEEHSAALRDAAARDLAARVEHCPEWDVADLVAHITSVHWFWATLVEERLAEPPAEERRPERAPLPDLLARAAQEAEHLVRALGEADPSAPCWTWAPDQQDVGFVLRHQVQEAAVHHWDAAHATGADWQMDRHAAADAVDEFLTFSVASRHWPKEGASMGGPLALATSDTQDLWLVTDGEVPGTLAVSRDAAGEAPVIVAPAADLLLWLYTRLELDTSAASPELVARFRSMTFTD